MIINVRGLANGMIQSVNPDTLVVLQKFIGFTTDDDYNKIPIYEDTSLMAQVQPVSSYNLTKVNNYNEGAVYKKFYVDGDWSGLSTADNKGMDRVLYNGGIWKVNQQPEKWGTWSLIIAVKI